MTSILPPTAEPAGDEPVRMAESGREPVVLRALQRRLAAASVATFDLVLPDGDVHRLGAGSPAFTLRMRTPRALRALASFDETALAEAYIGGDIDLAGDFLAAYDLRDILTDRHPLHSLWRYLRPLLFGRVNTDKHWVSRHYDYGNDFYFAFLDRRHRLYSQALFESDSQPLEDAAQSKLDYILRACRLSAGAQVLDVGGGWGAFARHAGARGVDTTMLTISREQFEALRQLSAGHGLPCRLEAVYESVFTYAPQRQYDAIVLLGVMEHLPEYRAAFAAFDRLMKPGGLLYMDFSAMRGRYRVGSFCYRHVFPGSHRPVDLPALMAAANRTRFEPVALHNDRHSYFLTLQRWAQNLEAARDALVASYGLRTFRVFQLYLWGCARQLQRDGELESYRVVFQKAHGAASAAVGLAG